MRQEGKRSKKEKESRRKKGKKEKRIKKEEGQEGKRRQLLSLFSIKMPKLKEVSAYLTEIFLFKIMNKLCEDGVNIQEGILAEYKELKTLREIAAKEVAKRLHHKDDVDRLCDIPRCLFGDIKQFL